MISLIQTPDMKVASSISETFGVWNQTLIQGLLISFCGTIPSFPFLPFLWLYKVQAIPLTQGLFYSLAA